MKKGLESCYPHIERVNTEHGSHSVHVGGMSIRLKIASDAMCAMLTNMEFMKVNAKTAIENKEKPDTFLAKTACCLADELIKLEEETRNE